MVMRLDCISDFAFWTCNYNKCYFSHQRKMLTIFPSKSDLDTTYMVDMALGTCSCPHGKDGSPFSHQGAIVLHFHHKALNFIPTMHASSRKQLAYIALGNRAEQSLDFYASLTQAEETQEIVHGSDMTSDGPDFSLHSCIICVSFSFNLIFKS